MIVTEDSDTKTRGQSSKSLVLIRETLEDMTGTGSPVGNIPQMVGARGALSRHNALDVELSRSL